MDPKRILYEDNHLLLYNKQPGDIVQGDKTGDEPLSEALKVYLKETCHKPGNVFLGVAHRIDRPVSGIVLFARTSKALARINALIRLGEMHKTYWAITGNVPADPSGHLMHYLTKNEQQNKSYASPFAKEGAKRAELTYSLMASGEHYHLLKIVLLTGRHHQIRVQLAHIGCPIMGDVKYGAPRPMKDGSIGLHAREINLLHPVRKTPLHMVADPPGNPLWQYFLTAINLKNDG